MGKWELLLTAVGLAMDAFSAAVGRGLGAARLRVRDAVCVGVWFGAFQAVMPLIGYVLGVRFAGLIRTVDHWVSFLLLTLIGGNMILESYRGKRSGSIQGEESQETAPPFSARRLFPLALATSMDALAVGVTLACLGGGIRTAAAVIGVVTFLLSAVGVAVGATCGSRLRTSADIIGGGVLILIGVHILLEHLGVWAFLAALRHHL